MKKTLLTLTLLALASFTAIAKPVKFAWDYVQPAPGVIGFELSYWQEGGPVQSVRVTDSTTLEATVDLPAGAWNVHVVAVVLDGINSDPSNLVSLFVPPAPANLRIVVP